MRLYAAVQCGTQTRNAGYEAEPGELVRGEMGGWRMVHSHRHADVADKVVHRKLLYHQADRQ